MDTTNKRFYDGIRHNSSITNLYLSSITFKGDITAHEILKACQEKNILTKLQFNTMPLVISGEQIMADILRGCTNLREIVYIHSRITDDQLLPMVEAIRGHASLERINLMNNNIGNAGCEALATLRNVTKVDICQNNIGNEGIISIANSLFENNNLREILIDDDYNNNPFDLRYVEDYFCRALCNTSSINDTYSSNHTLETLRIRQDKGAKLRSLLALNKETNKRHVAIKKILVHFPHNFDMEPLFDLSLEGDDSERDLKALPHVISWFETAKEAIGVGRPYNLEVRKVLANDLEKRKISAIYQFVTAMPMLFVPATATHDNV